MIIIDIQFTGSNYHLLGLPLDVSTASFYSNSVFFLIKYEEKHNGLFLEKLNLIDENINRRDKFLLQYHNQCKVVN